MPESPPRPRRIRILREEVSRKIAAGEVIDRPFSILRELLDNAIDAGASAIDVFLEAGGLGRIRVVDDGAGMGREDLADCWKPHATSKIESEDDLLRVSTLGFRGEALASIAICSRLTITSCEAANEPAHRLEVVGGVVQGIEASHGRQGTVVDVAELFFNFPARKKFLRSVSAESSLCRAIFIDRAVSHPAITFRLFTDGEVKLSLPRASHVERISLSYPQQIDPRMLFESAARGNGFAAEVVAARPEVRRRDRKLIQVFVNRRRVSEYSLMQAAEYGFSGFVPGGWYPIAFVFIDIDPGLVDFNIHPAKKEVRFRNLPEVHSSVVAAVRAGLGTAKLSQSPFEPARLRKAVSAPAAGGGALPFLPPEKSLPPVQADTAGIRFLGQVFGVFLVFELSGRLLILDQHAAHERIIYERLGTRVPKLQEMLFPLSFDVSEEEEGRLEANLEDLAGMGIQIRRVGSRSYEITAISDDFRPLREDVLVELVRGAGGEEWREALRATAACRLAIKEGDAVDPMTARELCAQSLRLAVPRCPHGRPLWHELSEDELRKLVDRPPVTASGPGASSPPA
ncbi:MAG TPA: DNA mismatch repair endonuclease MutL [Spirochaetia bacterium]|nr:DNA mismatch repair endonuclease MutL [Spirochaetia bacterium]